jgi:capsular polysaccharide biosynthesis protein
MNPVTQTYREPAVDDNYGESRSGDFPAERSPIPRLTVVQALLRNWLLVVLPAVMLAATGGIIAFSRTSTYTAEARLSVAKANPTSPAFGGFVVAAAALATVYSRAINAPQLVAPVSNRLHLSQAVVDARLSATPIQDSPIIRVIGTAPSAQAAESIANAGAAQLTTYVTNSNRANPDATRLLGLYQAAARLKAQNAAALARAQKALNSNPGNGSLQSTVVNDTARSDSLGVQLNALAGAYIQAQSSQAATELLSPLSSATSATSNRSSKVQDLAGLGLLTGLVLGVALAMWRSNLVMRQRLMA